MSIQILDSNKARLNWREILDKASVGAEDVVVERYGKPVVAVIAYEDYLALREELEELRAARRAAAAYEEWKQTPDAGRPWAEIEAELIADGLLDE
jgi:prevent-host-death family protein